MSFFFFFNFLSCCFVFVRGCVGFSCLNGSRFVLCVFRLLCECNGCCKTVRATFVLTVVVEFLSACFFMRSELAQVPHVDFVSVVRALF